jgi:hypothetical protein
MDLTFTDEELEGMAIQSIRSYLNKNFSDNYIKANFKYALKRMLYKANKAESNSVGSVKSIKEGDTTVNFGDISDTFVVDSEIMALLPPPYVKMY